MAATLSAPPAIERHGNADDRLWSSLMENPLGSPYLRRGQQTLWVRPTPTKRRAGSTSLVPPGGARGAATPSGPPRCRSVEEEDLETFASASVQPQRSMALIRSSWHLHMAPRTSAGQ